MIIPYAKEAGVALLGFVLVLTGHLLGVEWVRLVLGLFGAAT